MQVEWYGQSAFRLSDGGTTVFIDPFDDLTPLIESGRRWDYPAIEGVEADLLLVTHEHLDHNGVGACSSSPPATAPRSAPSRPTRSRGG
jgi:L-ascorbate metabolism protein UlaG (beta-lactamase superfamily)